MPLREFEVNLIELLNLPVEVRSHIADLSICVHVELMCEVKVRRYPTPELPITDATLRGFAGHWEFVSFSQPVGTAKQYHLINGGKSV